MTSTETRTVQERAREHAAYIGCDPRSTQLLSKAADRIDALERALHPARALIEMMKTAGYYEGAFEKALLVIDAALHPSDNEVK